MIALPAGASCTWTPTAGAVVDPRARSSSGGKRGDDGVVKAKELPAIISAFPLAIGVTPSVTHSSLHLDTPQISGHV